MITISLDEQGLYENKNQARNPIEFIGGIIYDDMDNPDDTNKEKERVKNYFKTICEEYSGTYPESLHVGRGRNDRVGDIKRAYNNTLSDFLQKGKYKNHIITSDDGSTRKGKYYTFAMVKTKDGKVFLKNKSVSNLINDDNASNLYMHMVEDTLEHLLFYNDSLKNVSSISFDLASRVYVKSDEEDITEHTKLGYNSKHMQDKNIVYLTNADILRTSVAREMLDREQCSLAIENFSVRSIDYYNADAGHEFLYLADAICSTIGFKLFYEEDRMYLQTIWSRMNQLTKGDKLLFSYDELDSLYIKSFRYAERGDFFEAFETYLDTFNQNIESSFLYKQVYNHVIKNKCIEILDPYLIASAIRKLSAYIRKNSVDMQKAVRIYETIRELSEKCEFKNSQEKAVLYDLYDAGISIYNACGNKNRVNECKNRCREYTKYIGVEKELRNRNKTVVSLCDSFKYEEALKMAKESYDYYKELNSLQSRIFQDELYGKHEIGICASQLAQCYAFLKEGKADEYFREALRIMDVNTPDYYITLSFYLHYILDNKDRALYEEKADEYFGNNKGIDNILAYLVEEGMNRRNPIIFFDYAICIFLMGIYEFNIGELTDDEMVKICHLEKTINQLNPKFVGFRTGHPYELILKYLCLISYKAGYAKISAEYEKKLMELKCPSGIIMIIQLTGLIEIARIKKDTKKENELIKNVEQMLISENSSLKGKLNGTYEQIKETITYMYE